ncbi:MAG: hypothetical protein JSU86_06810, partial [Phycisphaerales bacterium]
MFRLSHGLLNRNRLVPAFVGLASVFAAELEEARSQCEVDIAQVLPDDGASSDEAGYCVAVDGDLLAVGARGDDDNGSGSGSAYVVRRTDSGWIEEQKLLASDGAPDDQFGSSLAVSGDAVVVGAFGHGDGGAAYVFRFNGSQWAQEQRLLASDGSAGDSFGYSVAVSGNVALIGAYGVDDNGASSGSAYVFRFDGTEWAEEQKLLAADGAAYDFFGVSVALSGGVAVVGAYLDDDQGASSGSAYVFRFNGSRWTEEQKLVAADGAADDRFGGSVSVSGDVIVVGAVQDDDNGPNSGSAYAYGFNGSTWAEEEKLLPADGSANDKFGVSVAVSGDTVLAGAYMHDANEINDSGSAYVFRADGSSWPEVDKLLAPDGWYWDYFGFSVAASDNVLVAGAVQDDNNGNNSGSAYIFETLCAARDCVTASECTDSDPCTADVCSDGLCVHAPAPDFDGSGRVDLIDFELFQSCMTAPTGGASQPACLCSDLNADGPIDLGDFAVFQSAFSG